MSNAILPSFVGLTWGIQKNPIWNTNTADSISGRQYTLRRRLYPLWKFKLPYELLRSSATLLEMQQIVGFYNARNGKFDDWLYLDPRESTVVAQPTGTGDGTNKVFELVRTFASLTEPVGGASSILVYLNGVLKTLTTDYTVSADLRVITFVVAPGAGVVVTWSGTYYYRCRFLNDTLSLEEFAQRKWKTDLEFRSFRP